MNTNEITKTCKTIGIGQIEGITQQEYNEKKSIRLRVSESNSIFEYYGTYNKKDMNTLKLHDKVKINLKNYSVRGNPKKMTIKFEKIEI